MTHLKNAIIVTSMLLSPMLAFSQASKNITLDSSAIQIVADMKLGINLGNTFEAVDSGIGATGGWVLRTQEQFETAWGSPVITKEIISGYAKAGFTTLRVPVAWTNCMSEDGLYTISPNVVARVKTVTDWALSEGMYVIINEHWDYGWINKEFIANKDEAMKKYSAIWSQVSQAFKDYGVQVIFESQNEELGNFVDEKGQSIWNEWANQNDAKVKAGKEKAFALTNEINQKFVDIVRKSGGNNSKRLLLISGFNTNIGHTCNPLFKMPQDPAGKCAVSVHYYSPATFAILDSDASWGKNAKTWGTNYDLAELKNEVQRMKINFADKGIPVIVGEYGCPRKNKDHDSVVKYLSTVAKQFHKAGMCPVLWDIQTRGSADDPFHLYNRRAAKVAEPDVLKAIMEALE